MSQQLGIVALIDMVPAITEESLENNIYLLDNNQWLGSTGIGTGELTSAVEDIDGDVQTLNWLVIPMGTPPPTLPRSFFVQDIKTALTQDAATAQKTENALHPNLRILNSMGQQINPSEYANKRGGDDVVVPVGALMNTITGEAVDKRLLWPGEYDYPDYLYPNGRGFYWSATVTPSVLGVFAYTMHIDLYYYKNAKQHTLTLTYDARIQIGKEFTINGFTATPGLTPAHP